MAFGERSVEGQGGLTRPLGLKRPLYVPGASLFKNLVTAAFWYAGRGNCGGITYASAAASEDAGAREELWTYEIAEAAAREEDCRLGDVDGAADGGDAEKGSVLAHNDGYSRR